MLDVRNPVTNHDAQRRPTRLPWAIVLFAACVACWIASPQHAAASIQLPEFGQPEALTADMIQTEGASGASSSPTTADEDQPEAPAPPDELRDGAPLPPASSPTSGASTSGTSPSSFSTALAHAAQALAPQDSLATRVAEEARLTLPAPPGSDLLRPPQG